MQRQSFILRNKKVIRVRPPLPKPKVTKGVVKVEPFSTKKTSSELTPKEKLARDQKVLREARAKPKTSRGCGGCRRG